MKGVKGSQPPCTVSECDRKARARGWCMKHYMRWKTHGDPLITHRRDTTGMSIEDRLFHYTRITEACWLWEGSLLPDGYGNARWPGQTTTLVHRIAYELWVAPIPEDLEIDHLCFVRNCINPEHLEPVTKAENARRRGENARLVQA